jgi:hypothetical protein
MLTNFLSLQDLQKKHTFQCNDTYNYEMKGLPSTMHVSPEILVSGGMILITVSNNQTSERML